MPTADRGAIVTGWLLKLVVALGVFGLAAFDTVAIVAAHVNLTDDADAAAEAANQAYNETKGNVQAAYDAAVASAAQHGAAVPVNDFSITRDGVVHLTLTKTATTIVVSHIGPLKKQADVTATGDATTPAP